MAKLGLDVEYRKREVLPDQAEEGCCSRRKDDRFIIMVCPYFRLNAGATKKTVGLVTHKSRYQPYAAIFQG